MEKVGQKSDRDLTGQEINQNIMKRKTCPNSWVFILYLVAIDIMHKVWLFKRNILQVSLSLPQGIWLHLWVSLESPVHVMPADLGGGLSQALERALVPPEPQVSEQASQASHGL